MTTLRNLLCFALLPLMTAACSYEALTGAASRTVRNVCGNAPNCTVYGENGAPTKAPEPWDTKR